VSPKPEPNIDPLLRTAIEQRRLLRLRYKNRDRVVEPHDYGIQTVRSNCLGYQVGDSSSNKLPNCRWMDTTLISDMRILSQTFPGGTGGQGPEIIGSRFH
jgi:hypothetical protein